MSEGTQNQVLPREIEPRKFARQRVSLKGSMSIEAFDRLASLVERVKSVSANLQFEMSDENHFCLNGQVFATVDVQCQRCLEAFEEKLDVGVNLAMVWDEQGAQQLPSYFEPWVVIDESADLYAALEDELLLALPAVSYHETPCVDMSDYQQPAPSEESDIDADENKTNPFQVLEQLKRPQ